LLEIDISVPWTKRLLAVPSSVALKLITCVAPVHGMEKPVMRVSDALALLTASPTHSVDQQRRVRREFHMVASLYVRQSIRQEPDLLER